MRTEISAVTMSMPLTVEAGLQAEQDLLAAVCRGCQNHGLLFWQPSNRALVMPRRLSRLPAFEHACERLDACGWPILLRETGGEPVPQSAAVLNIALVYSLPCSESDEGQIETAYRRLCQPICDLLSELGGTPSLGEVEGAFCDGRFNVNLNGRKLVGTAQRWRQSQGGRRPVALVHGALLLDNEREAMVAAVNQFNVICDLEQRCQTSSHIALHEAFAVPELLARLNVLYQTQLAPLITV